MVFMSFCCPLKKKPIVFKLYFLFFFTFILFTVNLFFSFKKKILLHTFKLRNREASYTVYKVLFLLHINLSFTASLLNHFVHLI